MFNIKPAATVEPETEKMEALWGHYAKGHLNPNRVFEDEHPEVVARTLVEEIHAWEDWAMENYAETLEVA